MDKNSTVYVKVGDLKPGFVDVNTMVKVVNVGSPRVIFSRRDRSEHQIADALVGDETGSIILTLWERQIGKIKAGDTLEIKNGYTSLFKGSLRLNVGGRGTLEKVDKEIENVNLRNNLSEETHIRTPWRASERRPFRRRRRR